MTDQKIKSILEKLSTLRKALDDLASEPEASLSPVPASQKRRDLKSERVLRHEINFANGKYQRKK